MKLVTCLGWAVLTGVSVVYAADSQLPGAMLYWQMPLSSGSPGKQEQSGFGLRLGYTKFQDPFLPPQPYLFNRRPLVDLRFTGDGFDDFSMRGIGLGRAQRALGLEGPRTEHSRDPFAPGAHLVPGGRNGLGDRAAETREQTGSGLGLKQKDPQGIVPALPQE